VAALVVESPNYSAYGQLLLRRDASEFNSKRIRSSVMDDLTVQGQRVFLVYQQKSELVANFHVWTGGQVTHAQAAQTNIGWFTKPNGLFQTLVFDSQG
jgi:hypothetical protein